MHNKRFIIAIFWSLLIAFACLISFNTLNEVGTIDIPNIDKIIHFCFYTTFTIIWTWSLHYHKSHPNYIRKVSRVFGAAVLFGFIIELLQKYTTTTRSFEWWDVLANTSGAFLGILLITIFQKQTQPHY